MLSSFTRGKKKKALVFPCLQAEVAAVVMTGGLAHVCLVTSHMTVTRARIEMNIPRKRAGSSDHRKAISRFYEAVYQVYTTRLLRWRFRDARTHGNDFGCGTTVPGWPIYSTAWVRHGNGFPGGKDEVPTHTEQFRLNISTQWCQRASLVIDRFGGAYVCGLSVPSRTGDRTARQLSAGQVSASRQPRVREG